MNKITFQAAYALVGAVASILLLVSGLVALFVKPDPAMGYLLLEAAGGTAVVWSVMYGIAWMYKSDD